MFFKPRLIAILLLAIPLLGAAAGTYVFWDAERIGWPAIGMLLNSGLPGSLLIYYLATHGLFAGASGPVADYVLLVLLPFLLNLALWAVPARWLWRSARGAEQD